MSDFVLESLRGGMNSTDPAISLPDDQCVLAENVQFYNSMLGERRVGTSAISLPTSITDHDKVTFVFRHLPTLDESASELWVLGVTGTSSSTLARKTTTWSTVTVSDAADLTGTEKYQWCGRSIHGKLFLAYKSNVDRLHVYDGTSLRKVGLAGPTATPTAIDSGGAGSFTGTRYYRTREIVRDVTGTIRLRSEPSDVLTKVPSGTNASITVTKPADMGESATHWELEASLNNVNFYRIATTVVGTTTAVDSNGENDGYTSYTLSDDIEDYALIPSAKFLAIDADRLIWAGGYMGDDYACRVGWTPVYGASGVGNDERFETDTDPFRDLDTFENGKITGLSDSIIGANWVFKQHAVYKMVRSGKRTAAYNTIKYSDAVGAIEGSVVTAVDSEGSPAVYFLDHEVGPCMIGVGGLKRCGEDIRDTWEAINADATDVVAVGCYYPAHKQVIWSIATGSNDVPDKMIVLHIDKARKFADGVRKGWAVWTGTIATALAMCLYSENIDDNEPRSRNLVPFIGLTGLGHVHKFDPDSNDDNGTTFISTITTKPYILKTLLSQFRVFSAVILAKVIASSYITLKCIRNFGLETTCTVTDISLAGSGGSETQTIVKVDNFKGSELRVAQFQFTDSGNQSDRTWELNQFAVREEPGQVD